MADSSTWTPEREAMLRELHGSGLTFGEIAARLGGVTRNAVIGKANRLGLRLKPAAAPGFKSEPRARGRAAREETGGKGTARAPRNPGTHTARPDQAPSGTVGRAVRAPDFRILDKYYSSRKRRPVPSRSRDVPAPSARSGVLQKYYADKEKAERPRRRRREREDRALIRMRKAEEERARREAARLRKRKVQEARARQAPVRSDRPPRGADGARPIPDSRSAAVEGGARQTPSRTGSPAPATGSTRPEAVGPDGVPPREPLRVSLVALTETSCRWPLGDPEDGDFAFCGLPSLPRKPYCEDHAKQAYQPMASRRPRERTASGK